MAQLDESDRPNDPTRQARLIRQHSAALRQQSQELRERLNRLLDDLLRLRLVHLTCAECGRQARKDENPLDNWRSYPTGSELLNFCPECAKREFGVDARVGGSGARD